MIEYVVVQSNGDRGGWIVRPCRVEYRNGHRTCGCGNLAVTAGHYTSRREAEAAILDAEEDDFLLELDRVAGPSGQKEPGQAGLLLGEGAS